MKEKALSSKILDIATTARKLTEKFAKKHPSIGNPVDLECYCAIGSTILKMLAKEYGYDLIFIQGCYGHIPTNFINHCWVEYKDWVIDITASQFGIKEEVFVSRNKNAINHHPVLKNNKFDNQWGDQNPNRYKKPIKKLVDSVTSKY